MVVFSLCLSKKRFHDKFFDYYYSCNISSSSLALEPNVGLCLHNGPPPYPSIPWILLPVPMDCIGCNIFIITFRGHISGFLTGGFLRGGVVNPTPNPPTWRTRPHIYNSWDWVAQLYPQALGTHFSHLLRHAWATVGLFFNPGQID